MKRCNGHTSTTQSPGGQPPLFEPLARSTETQRDIFVQLYGSSPLQLFILVLYKCYKHTVLVYSIPTPSCPPCTQRSGLVGKELGLGERLREGLDDGEELWDTGVGEGEDEGVTD